MEINEDPKLKAAFAAFLIDSATNFEAAFKLYPTEKNRGEALRIAFAWPNDPAVILEIQRLKKDGVNNKDIPTKEQMIAEMWKLTKNEKVAPKDRATMARLVAEMLSFIPKVTDGNETSKRMPTAPVYKVVQN